MLSNKVSEITTREVILAPASSSIFDVMEMMAAKNVGGLIITEDQTPVGIFTERDVLKRVVHKRLDARKHSIKKVMTSPIHAVRADTHVVEALGKMYKSKFRHLPVRGEKKAIVGMISMRDILNFAVELGRGLAETRTIGSIVSGEPVTVDGSQSVAETVATMIDHNTGCAIVLAQNEPKGIFTERDVLKRVAVKEIDPQKTPVSRVMTTGFTSMSHSALIGEALAEMRHRGFRHLPIRDEGGKLTGIVSLVDVLKYAKALDVDEKIRQAWKEVEEFWESEEQYTPG